MTVDLPIVLLVVAIWVAIRFALRRPIAKAVREGRLPGTSAIVIYGLTLPLLVVMLAVSGVVALPWFMILLLAAASLVASLLVAYLLRDVFGLDQETENGKSA